MKRTASLVCLLFALSTGSGTAQNDAVPFVAMGDSLSEGVQSYDSSVRTQPYSYVNRIARQMRVIFPLPLIDTAPTALLSSTENRTRINPKLAGLNLAFAGANINALLNARFVPPVNTETDLILMPRTGSQMEIAEQLGARFHIIWVGSGDVISAILEWRQLNASQMTSVGAFTSGFTAMIDRLKVMNTKVVVGTIPDITKVGFLLGPQDLELFLGNSYGLTEGSFTTLPVALLIKLEYDGGALIGDPNYVLDPQEVAAIQTRIQELNQVITENASAAGMAVVDVYGQFLALTQNPPLFYGVPLTFRFLGGLLSIDGVHPSNIGHALIANGFIQTANAFHGLQIPPITQNELNEIAAVDPFVDWNGNLRVQGRPLAGLVETLGPFLGVTGDFGEGPGSRRTSPASKTDKRLGEAFKQEYLLLKGLPATTPWTREDAIAAMQSLFGALR